MLNNLLNSRLNDDRGAVAVMSALLMVALLGVAAFAVDMGIAYASKRELSVTADAAALAGAQAAGIQLQTLYPSGTSCTNAVAGQLLSSATGAASDVYDEQRPQNSAAASVTVACDGPDAIDVRVVAEATHDTVFGVVLGVDQLNPGSQSTARISGSRAYSGLRPFAVCDDNLVRGDQTQTQRSQYAKKDLVSCGPLPPGNWGLVDFDGGGNSNADLADWTRYGYNGPVTVPNPALPGDPGIDTSAPVKSALDSIVGDVVLLPVAQAWNPGSGNNATFNMPSLTAVKICGYQDGTKSPVKGDCWSDALAAEAPVQEAGVLQLQWQWRPWSASYLPGGSAGDCSLSNPNCIPAVRLYR
jgi:Flp pilus assembly protein TadG